jgi:hypothetical protein
MAEAFLTQPGRLAAVRRALSDDDSLALLREVADMRAEIKALRAHLACEQANHLETRLALIKARADG